MKTTTVVLSNNIFQLEKEDISCAENSTEIEKGSLYYYDFYCLALGLIGLEIWVEENCHESSEDSDPDFSFNYTVDFCSKNAYFLDEKYLLFDLPISPFVSNIKFGEFKACLFVVDELDDEMFKIPDLAINSPDFASHLYIVVDVNEESGIVKILGFIRHDEITNQENGIQYSETEFNYIIPLSSFNPEFSSLHTCINYASPAKILLPIAMPKRSNIISSIKNKIQGASINAIVLHQNIQKRIRFTWEEVQVILTTNEFTQDIAILVNQLRSNSLLNLLDRFNSTAPRWNGWFLPETVYQYMGSGMKDIKENPEYEDVIKKMLEKKIIQSQDFDKMIISAKSFKLNNFSLYFSLTIWKNNHQGSTKYSVLYFLKSNQKFHFLPEGISIILQDTARDESIENKVTNKRSYLSRSISLEQNDVVRFIVKYQEQTYYLGDFTCLEPRVDRPNLKSCITLSFSAT